MTLLTKRLVKGSPLTAAEFDANMTAVETKFAESVSVKDRGAAGDGTTDDSAAFRTARDAVEAGVQTLASGLGYNQPYNHVLIPLPAGRYYITDFETFLSKQTSANYKRKTVGYNVVGAGSGLTEIYYHPSSAATFLRNRAYLAVRFRGIKFITDVAACDFMESREADDTAGTNETNIQNYIFEDCHWQGWRDVFVVRGSNNNSEWRLFGCARTNCTGLLFNLDDSDQFLNYWIYGHSEGSNTGGFIKAVKGGHFHLFGVDISNWQPSVAATPLFDLRGQAHARGVTNLSVRALRVEAKNANCQMLYSEWPFGSLAFDNVDLTPSYQNDAWGAGQGFPTFGTMWELNPGNNPGSLLTVRNSALVGKVKTTTDTAAYFQQSASVFDTCEFVDAARPSDAYVVADTNSNYGGRAPVYFRGCRGKAQSGQSAWDWVANADRAAASRGVQVAWLRGANGKLENSVALTQLMPVGATLHKLILRIPILSTAHFGGTSQTGTVTITIKDNEGTPATVGTFTVVNPSLGKYQEITLDPPWELFDRELNATLSTQRATLTVTPTGLTAPLEGGAVGFVYQ